jgi:hypothetical protein
MDAFLLYPKQNLEHKRTRKLLDIIRARNQSLLQHTASLTGYHSSYKSTHRIMYMGSHQKLHKHSRRKSSDTAVDHDLGAYIY